MTLTEKKCSWICANHADWKIFAVKLCKYFIFKLA